MRLRMMMFVVMVLQISKLETIQCYTCNEYTTCPGRQRPPQNSKRYPSLQRQPRSRTYKRHRAKKTTYPGQKNGGKDPRGEVPADTGKRP